MIFLADSYVKRGVEELDYRERSMMGAGGSRRGPELPVRGRSTVNSAVTWPTVQIGVIMVCKSA